jgi:hypothetical protein
MKSIKTNTLVWVDVDDVTVIFRKMFNKFLRETYGFNISDDYVAHGWSYPEIIPKGDNFMDYFNSLPKNWTEHLDVFPFVKKYLDEIHNMGHYIIFITAVPDHGVPFRIKNLNLHKLYYDEIYFTSQDKSLYAKEILKKFENYDKIESVLIDDRAKNCLDFFQNVPNIKRLISLDAPFNSFEMELKTPITYHPNAQDMWEELMTYLKNK